MPENGMQFGLKDLEQLLQCPVCFDMPTLGRVEQCAGGHHYCSMCRTRLDSCPVCKQGFYGTRNFVAEELIRNFEIMKNIMLLTHTEPVEEPKETTSKKKKTGLSANAKPFVPTNATVERRHFNTPSTSKGLYPCRVPNCDVRLPLARLLNHVRTFHSDILTEATVDFLNNYIQSFEVSFKNKRPINRNTYVIFIRGIGLIYINLEILRSEYLIAFIQMGLKFSKCQEFVARLEFFSERHSYTYATRLISVRDNFHDMMRRQCCFTLNKTELHNICTNKTFKFKIRLSAYADDQVTFPNAEQINFVTGIRESLLLAEHKKKRTTVSNNLNSNEPSTSRSSVNARRFDSQNRNSNNIANNSRSESRRRQRRNRRRVTQLILF